MQKLASLNFSNSFHQLPKILYSKVEPQELDQPFLVSANPLAAALIDLDPGELHSADFPRYFSGQRQLPGSQPVAMLYSGHQFGGYNPQLGDGRGLLLGEVSSASHGKWDLHLKGAGKTPYSRFGDGRAVLRSSIREYLCSEAMAGLGIASTRALCVIGSHTPVYREQQEFAATLLRLARSHIRFGHFEYFHYNHHHDIVRRLADYVIEQQFPHLINHSEKYFEFLKSVVNATATLIAQWQAAGFAHGVMNTDNMSIIGDTFDYGPFAFLDDYEPGFICNHSDDQGRYAFNRQPSIGLWNLNALAHALSSLLSKEQLSAALADYEPRLIRHYNALMQAKLGFQQRHPGDPELLGELLDLLAAEKADYNIFFRKLCDFSPAQATAKISDDFIDQQRFNRWAERYRQRLLLENSDHSQRSEKMKQLNPLYILRNYLLQSAIEKAEEQKDYSEIEHLLMLVQKPFDQHPGYERYAEPPPDWGKKLQISCSS